MMPLAQQGLLLFMVLSSVCGTAAGQDAAPPVAASEDDVFADAASTYSLAAADAPDTPIRLIPKPLLTWSNPERATPSGAVFLYTQQGRPQAALCVYPSQGSLDHEFQSLSASPLLAHRDGALVWSPLQPGLEMKALEGAPPSERRLSRLTEMRSLMRAFQAAIVPPRRARKPLRLLTTPVYRYPADDLPPGIVDGAIFAFVQGTDPEVLLVVEAREQAPEMLCWHLGLARMSMVPLSVSRDGEEIWRTEWAVQSPTATYYTIRGN